VNEPPDDLASVLGPVPVPLSDPARRADTLAVTTRILHRGQRVRRGLVAAGVVVSFVAGGVSGWLVKPAAPVMVFNSPDPDIVPPSNPPTVIEEPLTPEELELRAELSDNPAETARLFREAGDRFLTVRRDYENAARCYRRHLSVADADVQKVSASDSWMLHTMKSPAR